MSRAPSESSEPSSRRSESKLGSKLRSSLGLRPKCPSVAFTTYIPSRFNFLTRDVLVSYFAAFCDYIRQQARSESKSEAKSSLQAQLVNSASDFEHNLNALIMRLKHTEDRTGQALLGFAIETVHWAMTARRSGYFVGEDKRALICDLETFNYFTQHYLQTPAKKSKGSKETKPREWNYEVRFRDLNDIQRQAKGVRSLF